MIGELISHYRVMRQIGAGGMGVVYLARDEQLERDVAIKVLAPGILGDEEEPVLFFCRSGRCQRLTDTTQSGKPMRAGGLRNCGPYRMTTQHIVMIRGRGENPKKQGENQA